MKFTGALPFVPVLARAFLVPDASVADQAPLTGPPSSGSDSHDEQSWWDSLPSKEALVSSLDETLDFLGSQVDSVVHAVDDIQTGLRNQLKEAIATASADADADADADAAGGRHHGHGHDFPDLTIYQLISISNYTKKFAKIVDEHPTVVELLNSTSANYTLFVPIDEAFDHIPDDHEKPSKEFVESVLLYHVGLGKYPARRILGTHTLPTALNETLLGDEPQRIRTSVGLTGVKLNFYNKVVAADVGAKNGVIHAVRNILVPPPFAGRELSLFPSQFSTLLLAYEKTDFVKFIHGVKTVGSTIFAPSNSAFSRLGPRANAFLFNTDKGLKYLTAILKYHIVPNATLYTDAFYHKTSTEESRIDSWEPEHYDLATLLDDTHVSVDIARLAGFISLRVNGGVHTSVNDGIAKNGVIHVVDKVLLPPHKHKHDEQSDDAVDVDVEDLKERLSGYVQ